MQSKSKIIKALCFSFFIFLLSILFWYLLKNFFLWQEDKIILNLIYLSISFSVFIIFSMVYLALIDNKKVIMVSSFFIVFSFFIFFSKKDGIWINWIVILGYFIPILILYAVFVSTNRNLIYEYKNNIVLHPGKYILKSMPSLLIVFAILFSVIFYFNFPMFNKYGKIALTEKQVEELSKPFGQTINKFIPIYDLDMSADEFIVLSSFMGLPFIKGEGEEELKPLLSIEKPPEEIINYLKDKGIDNPQEINLMEYVQKDSQFRELFMNEIKKLTPGADPYLLDKYRQNLSKSWGIRLSGEEKMGEVYTKFINKKINEFPKTIINLILIIPSLFLFFIMEIVFIISGFIYSLLCWILLIIFYKAKFYHYKKIEVEKEVLEL